MAGGGGTRWFGRGVIVLAALACLGTSRQRWVLEARLPPIVAFDGAGMLVTYEASQTAYANCGDRERGGSFWGDDAGSGERTHGSFFCPPGAPLTRVYIEAATHGGESCGCPDKAPPGAFVRVIGIQPAREWQVSTESEPMPMAQPAAGWRSYRVTVASSQPAFVHAVAADRAPAGDLVSWGVLQPGGGATATYRLEIPAVEPAPKTWRVRATLTGLCLGVGDCPPPPSASVRVLSVRPW